MTDSIADLQAKYKEVVGKNPPNKYINNEKWLMEQIDEALVKGPENMEPTITDPETTKPEAGPDTTPEIVPVDPPKTAAQEKKEAAAAKGKVPANVQKTGNDLLAQGLIGTFYSGDGEGGNWEMKIDTKGLSIKKLK